MLQTFSRLLVAGVIAAAAVPVCAQQTFGVVDINYLQASSDRGKEILQQLRKEFATEMDELRTKELELSALRLRLTQESGTLSADERVQLRHQAEDAQVELERLTQDAEIEVNKRKIELFSALDKDMLEVIDNLRQEKGLSAVFSKQTSVILSVDPELDLTSEALRRLNTKP